jgi:hypothetical protein
MEKMLQNKVLKDKKDKEILAKYSKEMKEKLN